MGLTGIDWLIMAVYSAFVIGIGLALKRCTRRFLSCRAVKSRVGIRRIQSGHRNWYKTPAALGLGALALALILNIIFR